MLDFTSALYLGLTHPGRSLGDYPQLTTGRPSALSEPPGAVETAAAFASLLGCEAASLFPSTMHAVWDLLGIAARRGASVLRDAGTYPIAAWGAERAASLGASVTLFRHLDAGHLAAKVERARAAGTWPLVVTDGYCIGCSRVAPLAEIAAIVRPAGGAVLVDDAQLFGIAGAQPGKDRPFGEGGGGSVPLHGLEGTPEVLVVSTLAKAFGAPITVVAGSRDWMDLLRSEGETRVYTSPPSVAAIRAAGAAYRENALHGDALRARLLARTRLFRERAQRAGARLGGGLFPVQDVLSASGAAASALHGRLLRRGVRGVVSSSACAPVPRVRFVLTASHEPRDLARAAEVLGEELRAMVEAGDSTFDLGT